MTKYAFILWAFSCLVLIQGTVGLRAQDNSPGEIPTKGDPIRPPAIELDTPYVFTPSRPLLSSDADSKRRRSVGGVNILFSSNGFGVGFFYQRQFNNDFDISLDMGISGARNTSEFETDYDPITNSFRVPNKINRLYMFPLMLSMNMLVFQSVLSENMRPFLSLGAGPTFIMATPYNLEFFRAFGYATTYTRFGAYAGIGTYIGTPLKSMSAVSIRYYYIPFGGSGLESVRKNPITDFGGLFINLSIGFR